MRRGSLTWVSSALASLVWSGLAVAQQEQPTSKGSPSPRNIVMIGDCDGAVKFSLRLAAMEL